MARMRLLDLAKPFSVVLPEVQLPYQKIDAMERALYTVGAAIIYVLLTEISLTGLKAPMESADPINWLRAPLAMSHGTPAELGLLPVILSGATFQMLAGLRKLSVSLDIRSERSSFQTIQKLAAFLISAVFAVVLAFGPNAFGDDHSATSTRTRINVALEIFLGSTVTIYLDEVLSKGYGLVPGSLLFTLITAGQKFLWSVFSLQSVEIPGVVGLKTFGLFPSLFFNLNSRSISYSITDFVFRDSGLPNLFDVVFAVVLFLGCVYLSFMKFNLQIRSTRMRGQSTMFPVRLLYTGALPVMYTAAILASFLLLSFGINNLLGTSNIAVKVLGVWDSETAVPVSGLAALFVPKFSGSLVFSVGRALVYPIFFAVTSGYVGSVWVACSGFAPNDIAKSFKENSIVIVGKRDTSATKELRKVIPLAGSLGGLILGALVGLSDLVGPAGWGVTMGVAALNLLAVIENLSQEGIISPDGLPQM